MFRPSARPNGEGRAQGAAWQPPSTWGSICDIRADVGDEKLMTYGRFHAGIRNLCSFLAMINGSLMSERGSRGSLATLS